MEPGAIRVEGPDRDALATYDGERNGHNRASEVLVRHTMRRLI